MSNLSFLRPARSLSFALLLSSIAASSSVTAQEEPPQTTGDASRARPLDSQAAVQLAIENNPSLRAARLEAERLQQTVLAEEGRYPFVFVAEAGYTDSEMPRLMPGNVVFAPLSRSFSLRTALKRTFPTGTITELSVRGDRFENVLPPSIAQTMSQGPGFSSSMRLSLSHPFLRGSGTRIGQAELRAARTSYTAAQRAEERSHSELIRDVLLAYWELWYAEESLAIDRFALELAQAQEAEAELRVKQGDSAPADLYAFATRVAELEESLAQSQATVEQRSIELTRLLGAVNSSGELLSAQTPPPERPSVASPFDLERALRDDSIELAELEAQVATAQVRAEVSGDASRPRLDAEGYVETAGVGSDIGSSLSRTGQFQWLTAHVGLSFEMPLTDTRRRAERAASLLAVSTAKENLRVARDRIAADAALRLSNERMAVRRLELARRTRELAQKTFEAEQERYRLGLSIAIQLRQAEEELRKTRLREARARVDVALEQTRLLHLMGHLLEEYPLVRREE